MNRISDEQLQLIAKQLIDQVKQDPRSSSEIARLANVSQPTISRIRLYNKTRQRISKSFNKLCKFYDLSYNEFEETNSKYDEKLKKAIIDAWDGTDTCAQSLLHVIEGLKTLGGKANDALGG
jgi:hypothetical protein